MRRDWIRLLGLAVIGLIIFLSLCMCESDGFDEEDVNCSECYEEKFALDNIVVYFSDDYADSVIITVYQGFYDNGQEIFSDIITNSPLNLTDVEVDSEYTVVATYYKGDDKINVIDSDCLKSRFVKGYCDIDCYFVTGGYFDCEIK